jgi:stage V sporulation protein B
LAGEKRSALQSAAILTLSSIGLQILGFAYRIFISRVTGAAGLGVFSLVMPVYAILISVTFSGITTAVTNLSSGLNALGDGGGMRRLIRTSLVLFFALFILAALPAAGFSGFISEKILGDGETQLALLIMLPCLFLTGIENIFKSWFYGIKNVKPPALSDQLEQIVRIAAVVCLLLAFRPSNPAMAAALIVAGMTVSETFSSVFLSVKYSLARPRTSTPAAHDGGRMLRRILAIAIPISASGLAGNILSSANTVLIPHRLMAAGMPQSDAVGALGILFGMAMPLFMLPMAFIGPLVMVMLPRLSEGCATNNRPDVRRQMGKALHATSLISLPAVAVMMPIGPSACMLLYGQALPGKYFVLLAAAAVFTYYQIITTGMLNGTGLQNRAMIYSIIGGVVELGFTWFAVADPRLGIYGFLWGMAISSALNAVLNLYCLTGKTGLRIDWRRWFVMPALAAAAVGLASTNVYILFENMGWNDTAAMAWSFFAGVAAALICLRIQGIKTWMYLKSLVPARHVKSMKTAAEAVYGFGWFFF